MTAMTALDCTTWIVQHDITQLTSPSLFEDYFDMLHRTKRRSRWPLGGEFEQIAFFCHHLHARHDRKLCA